MNSESLLDLMRTRRSLRQYHPGALPREMMEQVLTAAIWAPSAHNRQPWRFVVVENAELKAALALAMGARLRRDLTADGAPENVIQADVSRSYERITSAPALILVCLSMIDMDKYADEQRQQREKEMTIQSVAMAGQNLLLMAHELGLGACWMCAPLFCPDLIREVLDLPPDWEAQGLITLGYPAQQREKARYPLETRVLWK